MTSTYDLTIEKEKKTSTAAKKAQAFYADMTAEEKDAGVAVVIFEDDTSERLPVAGHTLEEMHAIIAAAGGSTAFLISPAHWVSLEHIEPAFGYAYVDGKLEGRIFTPVL
jgi:hypothetical protein